MTSPAAFAPLPTARPARATAWIAALLTALLALLIGSAALAGTPSTAHISAQLKSEAVRLEAALRRDTPMPDDNAAVLLDRAAGAIEVGEQAAARNLYRSSLRADPQNARAWLGLANVARQMRSDDWRERTRLQSEARAGAYLAFVRAGNDALRASALASLAAAYVATSNWRPAIDAYRASLGFEDNAGVRALYAELRGEHGFRVLDYSVDSDAAAPRICIQFSERLDTGTRDFAPYVIVGNAADTALSVSGSEICISGVEHGRHYDIVLRAGLPSDIDEALEGAADYRVYVRDRRPSVRFTGRNYVLAASGQSGIPVVSVNTASVDLEIHRIGVRGLAELLRGGRFLEQLAGVALESLREETAIPVWSGSMDVEEDRNRDVTTAMPVLEATGTLEPGVYVMSASAAGTDPDPWTERATQWFVVSDIGLTAITADDGIHVVVRSLASAEPLGGVSLQLIARNNDQLAGATSDADGVARFPAGLSRGTGGQAPGVLIARVGDSDFGFLDLSAQGFDFTDRGVEGRLAPGPLDAFVYTDRGVYRPGERVHVGALLRGRQGAAMPELPLTLVAERPDGVEQSRVQLADGGAGGRVHTLDLLSEAMTGTWRLRAYVDPDGDSVGEAAFLVEDYVPERIALTLTAPESHPARGGTTEIRLDAQYLYGAPAGGLEIGGEVLVRPGEAALPGLDGYVYGLDDEAAETALATIPTTLRTDADGRAIVAVDLPRAYVPRPLEARITLRVTEAGGRAVSRNVTVPLQPDGPVVALRPLQSPEALAPGSDAEFEVVLANTDGSLAASTGASWELLAVERDWQWYSYDGRWRAEAVDRTRRLASGNIDLTTDGPVRIAAPLGWGTHRLVVTTADGAQETSHTFAVGHGGVAPDSPDTLALTLDKDSYATGENMVVRVAPRFDAKVTIAILGDGLKAMKTLDAGPGGVEATFTVAEDWGTGAYAIAFAHRPLDISAGRMPGRAIGLKWFPVARDTRTIAVSLEAPAEVRPGTVLEAPVLFGGLEPGERAYVTVAAVDVGILNLTRFESPDPVEHLLGQTRLPADVRDLYGHLIDGMGTNAGRLRSGGDGAPGLLGDPPPDREPVALFSGILEADANGRAVANFEMPAFDGTVRLMAVAWSAGRVGSASADVLVRDPIVVSLTAPRFLAVGDRSSIGLSVHNITGPPGPYEVTAFADGPLGIDGGSAAQTLMLDSGMRVDVTLPVSATDVGPAALRVAISGPGVMLERTVGLDVSPASPLVERLVIEELAPSATLTLTSDLVEGLIPGTGRVSAAASPLSTILRGFNPQATVRALDDYPYACSEQLVSRALPLLTRDALATGYALGTDEEIAARIDMTIARVLSRQTTAGGFGLWRPDDGGLWLNAFVTDFLTRARERGHEVPTAALTSALDRLRNGLVNAVNYDEDNAGLAYAAYVLARNGRPIGNDVRYLSDTRLERFASPLARARIAAALTMFGEQERAGVVFANAVASLGEAPGAGLRADFGSALRDSAALLTLLVEANVGGEPAAEARRHLTERWRGRTVTSTQEKAWLLAAADALKREADSWRFSVDGAVVSGPLTVDVPADRLSVQDVAIRNDGDAPARIAVTVAGHPVDPLPPASNGYRIERTLYRLDGSEVDGDTVARNERLVVVLRITEEEAQGARALVVDYLPAGFEVENPSLVDGGGLEAFPWLVRQVEPVHVSFRDDRIVAAFNRAKGQSAFFDVAYVVRAVRPGAYAHPAAIVEDMYRPERFGRTGFASLNVTD